MPKNVDRDLSRRNSLASAACASSGALVPTGWLHAAAVATGGDLRLALIKRTTNVIDMHNHIFPGVGYKRGLRHLQLLHDNDDPVVPQGDLDTRPAHLGGLTPFGADIIRECNRLGILVDLAHAAPETLLAATKVATRPYIMSHVGFDYPVDETQRMYNVVKPRRLTKERAQVIADQGGVIGIWVYLARSPKEYVEDVRHMVDAVGIDHVGIGSDTELLSPRPGSTNSAWPGMTGGFFDAIAAEMLLQGFTPADIVKFGGGNYCRVFAKATAGHA